MREGSPPHLPEDPERSADELRSEVLVRRGASSLQIGPMPLFWKYAALRISAAEVTARVALRPFASRLRRLRRFAEQCEGETATLEVPAQSHVAFGQFRFADSD